MAAGLRKLLDGSDDSQSKGEICRSSCGDSYSGGQICSQACIQLCPLLCNSDIPPSPAPVPAPAPAPSDIDSVIFPGFPGIPARSINTSIFLTISLSALAAAFVFFTFLAIRKFYTIVCDPRRRRRPRLRRVEDSSDRPGADEFIDQNQGRVVDHPIWHIRTVGLPPSVINGIAIVRYTKGQIKSGSTVCAVCLSEFQEDETLRLLPRCNHPFHLPCIDTWLRSHTNCPICRVAIVENSARLPAGDRPPQNPDESRVELHRVSDTETENQPSEMGISIGFPTEQKPNGNFVGDGAPSFGRSVSMDPRIGQPDPNPPSGSGEAFSERLIAETEACSSSSSSSPSIKRSASCHS